MAICVLTDVLLSVGDYVIKVLVREMGETFYDIQAVYHLSVYCE